MLPAPNFFVQEERAHELMKDLRGPKRLIERHVLDVETTLPKLRSLENVLLKTDLHKVAPHLTQLRVDLDELLKHVRDQLKQYG